ncbi:MAG: hypothetical protein JRN06_01475 [Nitrososphaerota archaeon]|nr:hypothetical protein [Nitrososphaerota archaeon]MDG7023477.1 hypothetical protein [Nitrososphaerota archaeon]
MPRKTAKTRKADERKSPGKAESATSTSAQGPTAPRTEKKEPPERYELSPYQ